MVHKNNDKNDDDDDNDENDGYDFFTKDKDDNKSGHNFGLLTYLSVNDNDRTQRHKEGSLN